MSFPAEILRVGISIANGLTKGVQPFFLHEAWIAQSGSGAPTYAAPVPVQGVIDTTRKQVTTTGGVLVTVVATITVVGDMAPNGASGRFEPVDPRDRITLSDGTTGPIIESPGAPIDPATNRAFIQSIQIGEVGV